MLAEMLPRLRQKHRDLFLVLVPRHFERAGAVSQELEARGVKFIRRSEITPRTQFAANDHRSFNRDGQKFNVGETFAGLPLALGIELADALKALVPAGMTMAQFALRWCLDFAEVTTVIPGAKRAEQARQNAAASELPALGPALHEQLRRWYREQVAGHIRGVY